MDHELKNLVLNINQHGGFIWSAPPDCRGKTEKHSSRWWT